MKKTLIMIAALVTSGVFAQVAVNGTVGADTNNVYRGVSLSNKQPSVNGNLNVSKSFDGASVYVNTDVSSVNTGDQRAVSRTEIGVKVPVLGTGLIGGYRYNSFASGNNKSLANDELFVGVRVPFVVGTGTFDYTKGLGINAGQDQYVKFGYQLPVKQVSGLNVGLASAWKHYQSNGNTRYNNTELSASYVVVKNVNTFALVSLGGRDELGTKMSNQGSVGVKYTF